MDTHQSEELALRQYLLGQLDVSADIAERLEERILMDGDFAELAGVIEDEIIEDYLEGALDPVELDAFNKHFLRPPERKEKLGLARLVSEELERRAKVDSPVLPPVWQKPPKVAPPVPPPVWRNIGMWAGLAVVCALLLFAIPYGLIKRTEVNAMRAAQAKSAQQLSAERERSSRLDRQLQDLRQLVQPATVMLNLFQPSVRRGEGVLPTVTISSGTKKIHVEIALPPIPPGPIDVQLKNAAGDIIWKANGQPPFSSGSFALLILDVPAAGIRPGQYSLVLSQPGAESPLHYRFSVVTM